MVTLDEVTQAIATIEDSRSTHVDWRDWLTAHPDDPRVAGVGDAQFHAKCVQDYDQVLAVMRSLCDLLAEGAGS